jgi:hypothetical protein
MFCGKGDRPDAPRVCFTDPANTSSSLHSEEQERELREELRRRAEELRKRLTLPPNPKCLPPSLCASTM